MKKLYEVRAEVVVYVLAEDDNDAFDVGTQSVKDEVDWNGVEVSSVHAVTQRKWHLENGWSRGTLVYGADKETTLGEALDALPEAP